MVVDPSAATSSARCSSGTGAVAPAPAPRQAQGVTHDIVWSALALVLVIEGLLPFFSPGSWRAAFAQLLQLRDGQLRFFGLCSIVLGLLLLWLSTGRLSAYGRRPGRIPV